MSQLTEEQTAVVRSNARLLAVDAFAGSGKTKTLDAYARARPRASMLYIAFNKSVAAEARERFPKHVDCRTTHSLAYAAVGAKYREKLGNVQPFEAAQFLGCHTRRAKTVLEVIGAWLCSTDEMIVADHIDEAARQAEPDEVDGIVEQARAVWEQMKDLRSRLRMPHDGYLKLWALSKPRLRYDIILLDEAQDTNPVTLGVVLQQRDARLVLVGDRHQGIYGFRKALNAMEIVNAEQRIALTRSFRFGQGVADVATALLRAFKDEQHPVLGRSDLDVTWRVNTDAHYAMLGRTNAGLFGTGAQAVLGNSGKRLHFVGGFDSYLFGKVLDAYYLWAGERSRIKDQAISRFLKFDAFKEYGDEASDAEVKALVKVVEQYRHQVPVIHAAMKDAEVQDERQAHITLSTAHRAKGLEWDQVFLADDFIELPPKEDFDPEEINLLYVAITRAIKAVRLPLNLAGWLQDRGDVCLDQQAPPADEQSAEDSGQGVAAEADETLSTEDKQEEWLRQHAASFGAAEKQIAFLLQRLDEARAKRDASESPVPDCPCARCWELSSRAT